MADGKLWPRHLRAAKPTPICMSGGRQWFAQRGWSWNDFVLNGRDLQQFRDTNCPLALRACAAADAEAEAEVNDGR